MGVSYVSNECGKRGGRRRSWGSGVVELGEGDGGR